MNGVCSRLSKGDLARKEAEARLMRGKEEEGSVRVTTSLQMPKRQETLEPEEQ